MSYDPGVAPVDTSNLATKDELTTGLNGKANASTVGGLATAINSKAAQSDLEAIAAQLPAKASQASVDALSSSVAAKASQSAVDSLSTSVADKASTSALNALAASVPAPAAAVPPAVADSSALGTETSKFALANHTHSSKLRKGKTTTSSATVTWVYPTPFAAGVSPICLAIAQAPAGSTDLFNVQLNGTPTNTQCVFQINRVSPGLLSLLLGALSINPNPAANVVIHMTALEP